MKASAKIILLMGFLGLSFFVSTGFSSVQYVSATQRTSINYQTEHYTNQYSFNDIRDMLRSNSAIGTKRVYRPDDSPKTYHLQANQLFTDLDSLYTRSGATTPAHTSLITSSRPIDQQIVIVLMGDGFTASQIGNWPNPMSGTFLYSAYGVANTIISMYPFSLFRDYFTIYAAHVISTQSGIAVGPVPFAGTYLGTHLLQAWNLRMTRVTRALQISHGISSQAIMTQVIANTTIGGGVAYWATANQNNINTVGVSTRFTNTVIAGWNRPAYHSIVIHEIGHNFGQLVDEHATGFGAPNLAHANMASSSDTDSQLKWGHWLGHDGIKRRTENAPNGFMFPSTNHTCKMQGWRATFCAVCRAELVRRMALISRETFQSGRLPNGSIRPSPSEFVKPVSANRVLPYAFNGNKILQNITIQANQTEIGNFAFLGATGLRTITNRATVPQLINNTTFAGVNRADVKVIVPTGTTHAYRDAGWTEFIIVERHILIAQQGTFTALASDKEINLRSGNDTTFTVVIHAGSEQLARLSFESRGDSTLVSSCSRWQSNSALNQVHVFSTIRITFRQNYFSIVAPGTSLANVQFPLDKVATLVATTIDFGPLETMNSIAGHNLTWEKPLDLGRYTLDWRTGWANFGLDLVGNYNTVLVRFFGNNSQYQYIRLIGNGSGRTTHISSSWFSVFSGNIQLLPGGARIYATESTGFRLQFIGSITQSFAFAFPITGISVEATWVNTESSRIRGLPFSFEPIQWSNHLAPGRYTMDAFDTSLSLFGNNNDIQINFHLWDGRHLFIRFTGHGAFTRITGNWATINGDVNLTAGMIRSGFASFNLYIPGHFTGNLNLGSSLRHTTIEVARTPLRSNTISGNLIGFVPW